MPYRILRLSAPAFAIIMHFAPALALSCPPKAGAPPTWCFTQRFMQVPPVPQAPSAPLPQQSTYSPPQAVMQAAPMQPQQGWPMQLSQPPQQQQQPQQLYSSVCFIDNAGNGCQLVNQTPIQSGTPCYCGQYNGVTQ